MEKTETIERLEYLKAKAQLALEQEVPEWIAEDLLGTIEAYDIAIEALQTENSSEKPNNCETCKEVIRCKDCKHSDTVTYPSGITEMTCPIMFETDCDDPFCGTWLIVDPNDFCSYGEVRDE